MRHTVRDQLGLELQQLGLVGHSQAHSMSIDREWQAISQRPIAGGFARSVGGLRDHGTGRQISSNDDVVPQRFNRNKIDDGGISRRCQRQNRNAFGPPLVVREEYFSPVFFASRYFCCDKRHHNRSRSG